MLNVRCLGWHFFLKVMPKLDYLGVLFQELWLRGVGDYEKQNKKNFGKGHH